MIRGNENGEKGWAERKRLGFFDRLVERAGRLQEEKVHPHSIFRHLFTEED